VIRKLERAGFETWAVGGIVRDALAGRPADDDWDLATRARPEQMRAVFGRVVPIGVEHGTMGVLTRERMYEVTTFRRDVETFGRRATVEFADDIDEDLARRDFTINAIAWHPLRHEMRDPFDGASDLAAGTLRTVGDARTRFTEDFLRILRALRFAGRFALAIEPNTWAALCEHRQHLADLSPERVREELTKVLGSTRPSRALSLYAAAGVLPILYPELARCLSPRAPDGLDAWSVALQMVDIISRNHQSARLACLLAGIGLPSRGVGEGLSAEERSGMRAAALMERLRYSRAEIEGVSALVRTVASGPAPGSGPALRRWLRQTRRVDRRHLFRIWIARARLDAAREAPSPESAVLSRWKAVRAELAMDPPLRLTDLALGGRDLIEMGMRPGPGFGTVLAHLLDLVLDDPALNRRSILARRARHYIDARAQASGSPRGRA
jgi:tRNA nucleotidyltransferase (CCA-adding enzyme)